MMNIENTIFTETNIFDLAPQITKKDYADVLQVIDRLFIKYILLNYRYLRYLERIDTMQSEELDLLAEELDVDFYDFELSLSEKRKLCKAAFEIQSIKGTPASIKKVLDFFYKRDEILEFTDFNGEAGTFKVEITGSSDGSKNQKMIDRINLTKKHSQHLAGISFKEQMTITVNAKTGRYDYIKTARR